MASAFNKFQPFIAGVHNGLHILNTDQLRIALCNASNAPVATYATHSQLTPIAYTNLTPSPLNVTTTSSTQSSGVYRLILQDLLLTATGSVATFRYVVLYNYTGSAAARGQDLIAWWDYGGDVTLANTETFNIDFDGVNGVFSNT